MEESYIVVDNFLFVRESVFFDFLISFLSFVMFIGAFVTINFSTGYSFGVYKAVFSLTLFPAIIFLIKGIRNKIIILINANGIFYRGKLIASWENLVSAYITEDETPGSFAVNFKLAIVYNVPETWERYLIKLPMSTTQNKSEEEIISAINIYVKDSGIKKEN